MPLFSDTHPQAEAVIIEGYRKMSAAAKLHQVASLTRSVQALAIAGIRERYGTIDDDELRLRLAALWLARETMLKAFDWDPDEKGM